MIIKLLLKNKIEIFDFFLRPFVFFFCIFNGDIQKSFFRFCLTKNVSVPKRISLEKETTKKNARPYHTGH